MSNFFLAFLVGINLMSVQGIRASEHGSPAKATVCSDESGTFYGLVIAHGKGFTDLPPSPTIARNNGMKVEMLIFNEWTFFDDKYVKATDIRKMAENYRHLGFDTIILKKCKTALFGDAIICTGPGVLVSSEDPSVIALTADEE